MISHIPNFSLYVLIFLGSSSHLHLDNSNKQKKKRKEKEKKKRKQITRRLVDVIVGFQISPYFKVAL